MAIKPTIAAPAGLDTLSADDMKLMDAMRDESPAPEATPEPAPAAERPAPAKVAEPAAEEIEIDVDPAPELAADPKTRTVPQQALHQEREKRKAIEKTLAEAQIKFAADQARAQERLDLLAAAITAPASAPTPAAEAALPDVNTEPVEHFRALAERQAKSVQDLKAIITGMQENGRRNAQIADLRNWGAQQERVFAAQEPAYPDAMKFLEESRHAELERVGVLDPNERAKIIGSDIQAIATRARAEGADFAARLYGVAEARGFKKAAPAETTAAIPALDAPLPLPDAAERIEHGRQNSMTLGSVGAAPPARLSVEKIANMPEKDFAVLYEKIKHDPVKLRELMGS